MHTEKYRADNPQLPQASSGGKRPVGALSAKRRKKSKDVSPTRQTSLLFFERKSDEDIKKEEEAEGFLSEECAASTAAVIVIPDNSEDEFYNGAVPDTTQKAATTSSVPAKKPAKPAAKPAAKPKKRKQPVSDSGSVRKCDEVEAEVEVEAEAEEDSGDALRCSVCGRPYSAMLCDAVLCDTCPKAFHTRCLATPLEAVPEGDWLCPCCVEEGVETEAAAEEEVAGGGGDDEDDDAAEKKEVNLPDEVTLHLSRLSQTCNRAPPPASAPPTLLLLTPACAFAAPIHCHGEGCEAPEGRPCRAQSRVPPLPCLALSCRSPELHLACQRPNWLCSACTRRARPSASIDDRDVVKKQQREKAEQG
eukprot:scaffold62750_cov52-Phaeocystis_antarctica.AAC.5